MLYLFRLASAFFLVGLLLVSHTGVQAAGPRDSFPERYKNADVVFLGLPISEKATHLKRKDLDYVTLFDVQKVFKGKVEKRASIYFLRDIEEREGEADTHSSFEGAIKLKIPELVYARSIKGLLITADEFGGGSTVGSSERAEITELEKMQKKK